MLELPVITSILTVPGFDTTTGQQRPPDRTVLSPAETILVGLVIDRDRVAWGSCLAATSWRPDEVFVPFRTEEGMATIEKVIMPALKGQRLDDFRRLIGRVEALTEEVTITQALPEPQVKDQARTFSRRDLFTGRLQPCPRSDGARPRSKRVTIERPIQPAIRYGISQALLSAVARAKGMSMAELISKEYGLSMPMAAVPIQAEFASVRRAAVEPIMAYRPASLGYATVGHDPEAELGINAELLQRQVRALKQHIAAASEPTYRPIIHVDVHGGLGRLYDHNPGKILGALVGLEQAAAPFMLRVENSVRESNGRSPVEELRRLQEYVRMRGMTVKLVSGGDFDTLEEAKTLIEADAVHMIRLVMGRLGGLNQTVEAIIAARQHGTGILLEGRPAEIEAQVALATQPDVVVAQPGQAGLIALHNEMARAVAWSAARDE
jgi:methylaspartate ammonia-lyase